MKNLTLDGRLGKDCEKLVSRVTGKPYLRFSLANSTFSNGETKTEWFDITTTNSKYVDNDKIVKFLTKGRYVVVSGRLKTEVKVNNSKVYCNQHVDADFIEGLSTGNSQREKEEEEVAKVSTYTGNTHSIVAEQAPAPAPVASAPRPEPQPAVAAATVSVNDFNNTDSDDLPF